MTADRLDCMTLDACPLSADMKRRRGRGIVGMPFIQQVAAFSTTEADKAAQQTKTIEERSIVEKFSSINSNLPEIRKTEHPINKLLSTHLRLIKYSQVIFQGPQFSFQ